MSYHQETYCTYYKAHAMKLRCKNCKDETSGYLYDYIQVFPQRIPYTHGSRQKALEEGYIVEYQQMYDVEHEGQCVKCKQNIIVYP